MSMSKVCYLLPKRICNMVFSPVTRLKITNDLLGIWYIITMFLSMNKENRFQVSIEDV